MRLRWETSAPDQLGRIFESLSAPVPREREGGRFAIGFANASLEVAPLAVLGPGQRRPDDRISLADDRPACDEDHGLPSLRLGVATVDAERYAAERGWRLVPLPPDRVLGASCWSVAKRDLLLLEPNTEARLAATLARHDEGPAVLYVSPSADLQTSADELRTRGLATTVTADGPFGPEFAVGGGPIWGPHIVVCQFHDVGPVSISP